MTTIPGTRGLSLIESMILVAVIGFLAAVAPLAYQSVRGSWAIGEGISLAAERKVTVTEAFLTTGRLSGLNGGVSGIPADTDRVTTTNGVIVVTLKPGGAPCAAGKTMTYTPRESPNGIWWTMTTTANCEWHFRQP